MKRFIEGAERSQWTLLPESLDDWVGEDNPVRAIDAFVDALDLAELGFKAEPAATGRPSFHPSVLLKLYIAHVHESAQRFHESAQPWSCLAGAALEVAAHTAPRGGVRGRRLTLVAF